MFAKKHQQLFYYLLVLLLILVYVSGLFIDVTRDAAKYAYISKEIIQTNNWINLQILGENYNQKPHAPFYLREPDHTISAPGESRPVTKTHPSASTA